MNIEYKELEASTTDDGRTYHTPAGSLPSITTILRKTKDMTWLYKWQNRVGKEKAAAITAKSAARGNKIHKHMENRMGGKKVDLSEATADEVQMYHGLKYFESDITSVYGREVPLYSPTLKYAGRTDLVGEWKNVPAIIDYKTAIKARKREWIKDYFLQGLGYSLAHNELYGTKINLIVVLITVENDLPQCFTLDTREEDWVYDELGERLASFYKQFPGGKFK